MSIPCFSTNTTLDKEGALGAYEGLGGAGAVEGSDEDLKRSFFGR